MESSCSKIKKLVINKSKRRTRFESNQDRNYSCGCGKSYLSYPALYLHLRNKHKGVAPEGTLLPKQGGQNTRGRPRTISGENREESRQTPHQVDYNLQALKTYLATIDPLFRTVIKGDLCCSIFVSSVKLYFSECPLVSDHPAYQ